MNNLQKLNPYISGYPDIFNCMGFDEPEFCEYSFDTHTLLYIYSGTLELYDSNGSETVNAGECAFIKKNERLMLSAHPTQNEACHVMKLLIPRGFLCEIYHCGYCGYDANIKDDATASGHRLPECAAITSLFQSLIPFYEAGMEIPQNLHRLKLTEAVLAVLSLKPESFGCLFDFSRNPMSLLDMVNNTKANPMNWVRVADEILPALN